MEIITKANGIIIWKMGRELIYLHLDQDMKDVGWMINIINKDNSVIQMEISMRVYMRMDRKQAREYIDMHKMDLNIKESGLEIREVGMDEWNMQMEISIKGFGRKVKGMERVVINIITGINMMVNLWMIRNMGMEC